MNVNLKTAGIILCLILPCTISLNAQTKKYPADIEEKIRLVENNLSGWVQTGSNDTRTLAEEMKKFNINGTTITIKKGDNGLLLNVYKDVFWNVYFTSDSDFFIREFRGFLRFQTDKDNKVTGFNFNGGTVKKIE
jgi:hypothetical protein